MKKQYNIEELFQKSFKDFEADPGPNAWKAIQSGISGSSVIGTAASKATFSWLTTAIVGVSISAIAIAGYFFFGKDAEQKQEVEITPKHTEVITDSEKTSSIIDQKEKSDVIETPAENLDTEIDKNKKVSPKQPENKTTSSKSDNFTQHFEEETTESIEEVVTIAEDYTNTSENTKPEVVKSAEANTSAFSENSSAIGNSDVSVEPSAKTQENNTDNTSLAVEKTEETKSSQETVIAPNIHLPNFFSPNFDGKADVFIIRSDEVDKMEIKIFSAMGSQKPVFEKEAQTLIEWDGTLPNGNIAPKGQYYYVLYLYKDDQRDVKKESLRIL